MCVKFFDIPQLSLHSTRRYAPGNGFHFLLLVCLNIKTTVYDVADRVQHISADGVRCKNLSTQVLDADRSPCAQHHIIFRS